MRILIVEDEASLREQLRKQLTAAGYVVDVAPDGLEGQYLATEYAFDLAIIDLGLPKINGVGLISSLRQRQISTPVLVLTARSHWRDKVEGLEAGADDYLTKPFQMEELLARVNALIRRSAGHATPIISLGPLSVNTASQQAYLEKEELDLTSFEYKLLTYLLMGQQRIISKTELTEHLYAQDFDRDSNVIEVLIGRLRRKLAPYPLIQTARGRGYRMSLPDALAEQSVTPT
ncbi:MAG TPA: DNA-binding response regulator [Gammaproteobacteria bacterium]|jgi:two-component system response regulator PhoP|nr:DNA-binding response regulator [Gammaproteobacteria bacterium]HBX00215.1 DNA-binding response regulator [Gammaproteobacteria bacterium]|tara:strand:+ start:510 stop:1205 length:696 start_codon:yes stop_codon:yes gene_type:complete